MNVATRSPGWTPSDDSAPATRAAARATSANVVSCVPVPVAVTTRLVPWIVEPCSSSRRTCSGTSIIVLVITRPPHRGPGDAGVCRSTLPQDSGRRKA
jgi:hypothetical protein